METKDVGGAWQPQKKAHINGEFLYVLAGIVHCLKGRRQDRRPAEEDYVLRTLPKPRGKHWKRNGISLSKLPPRRTICARVKSVFGEPRKFITKPGS